MNPMLILVGGLILVLGLIMLASGLWHPRSGREIVGGSLRSEEAEAEIERDDIEQMIEALDERRRRAGRPSIGDELAREIDPQRSASRRREP